MQGTVKLGGGNIMVWGCMGWNGVGQLAEIEGKMDADQFVSILEEHLLPGLVMCLHLYFSHCSPIEFGPDILSMVF